MGLEVDPKYEGTGTTFLSAILVIEEIARIDPSVSTLVDVHNTLVNTLVQKYGSEEQKKAYLPRLSRSCVRILSN